MSQLKTMKMKKCDEKEAVIENSGCVFVQPSEFKWEPYTYTFQSTPFSRSDIDQKSSLENAQNRIDGKMNKDYGYKYKNSLEKGHIFPAIVVTKDKNGLIVKSDGFHTDFAMDLLGVEFIEGIYLFSHPDAIDIGAEFNSRTNGVGEKIEETLEKAIRCCNRHKIKCQQTGEPVRPNKTWADKFCIPEEAFNKALRISDLKKDLAKRNIQVDNIKHKTSFDAILKVNNVDKQGACRIATMASMYGLAAETVKELTDDYLDNSLTFEEKSRKLSSMEEKFKKRTNNGKIKSSGIKKRATPELKIKEDLMRISHNAKKIDLDKIKNMIFDNDFKNSIEFLSLFLKNVLK
jgi:hypothetical protein